MSQGLTPESLAALLGFLDPDPERAGILYEAIRRRLVRLFEWRGFSNPEDLTDETFNRVARRLLEGVKVGSENPYGYFCGVAQLLCKEMGRRAARERTAIERWLPDFPVDDSETDERLTCLHNCLAELPEDQRLLVLRYHQANDHIRSRQSLAKELGLPMNALRIRVHRIRKKLEDCVRDCLREGSGRDHR
ncbi:MAG TPA: sigma-70 family RNA polymerase sigma factor [Thermoanaerobaculia bacterium]|nr:sigma-70 family RNA polymerase sigma factor [Thermoanaerobaculia bacterium]